MRKEENLCSRSCFALQMPFSAMCVYTQHKEALWKQTRHLPPSGHVSSVAFPLHTQGSALCGPPIFSISSKRCS